jgi:SAM-dependent methyltransferase
MVPFRFGPWARELIDRVPLRDGARMLDIACGTGVVAREAARRNSTTQVSGLDMNPQMIEVAAARSKEEGLPIAWHVGTADALPFEDRSFDLVTIQQAFQFFPDKPAALAEIRRVLQFGGVFALNIWASHDQQGINGAFADSVARVTGAASMHTPYAMGDIDVISDMLTDAGFAVDSIELVEIECTWTPVETFVGLLLEGVSAGVPAMHGRSDEERAAIAVAIEADMSDALAHYTVGDRVVTPSTSNIVLSHVA